MLIVRRIGVEDMKEDSEVNMDIERSGYTLYTCVTCKVCTKKKKKSSRS